LGVQGAGAATAGCLPETDRGEKSPSARGVNGLFKDRRPSEPPTLSGPCGEGDRPVADKVRKPCCMW
jgi:hypothetical protein